MTQSEIIKALIDTYKAAINEILEIEDIKSIRRILFKYKVDFGVCNCAYNLSRESIIGEAWVYRHQKLALGYWCKPPISFVEKHEILESLNYRLNILENEFKRTSKTPT